MSEKAPPKAGRSAPECRESSDSSNARSEQERLSFQIALSRARAEQMARRTIDEAAAAPIATPARGASVPTSASVHHALGASNLSNLGGTASLQSLAGFRGNYGSSLYSVPGRPLTEFQLRNNAGTTAAATHQAQSLLPSTTTYRIIPAPNAGMEASQEARASYLQLPQQQYYVTNLQQPSPFDRALAEAANRRHNDPPAAAAPFTLSSGLPGGIQVSVRRVADGVPATEFALDPRLVVLLRDGVGAPAGFNLLPSVMPLTGTVGAPAVSLMTAAGAATGANAGQQGNQDRRNGSLAPTGPKRKRRKYDHESFPEKVREGLMAFDFHFVIHLINSLVGVFCLFSASPFDS